MYKGKELSLQSNNIILNGKRNIISVINLNKKKNVNEVNYILCPKCSNLQFLNINEDKISMTNCINKHKYLDLSINNFIKRQNELKINCSICNNNKLLYNNNFYIYSCGKNICKLCRDNHNIKNHNIIEYNRRYYTCNIHDKTLLSFCCDCNQNLCQQCEQMHKKHKIILYKKEMPNDAKIKDMRKEIEENISNIKEVIKQIKKLNQLFNSYITNVYNYYEQYIKLYDKMIYCMDNLRNYESIKNISKFKIKSEDINRFLN